MDNYEKLGAFYLGKKYDLDKNEITQDLLLYDSRDLTTHAVCLGMTGSGKTGLCVSLLEEAVIDGIPAIIVDPKGDMTNLLLSFPALSAEDFLPWIDRSEASKKGQTPEDYAAAQAELWRNGLKSWGQSGERIEKLKQSADFAIYTPGSDAGRSISILKSFAAPSSEVLEDQDTYNDRISSTTTSLLGLLGIKADPIKSREHILLSTILDVFWQRGQDLDLIRLIHAVQTPPFDKVGVFDLETFYPPSERFELAMALNNLLAARGFSTWLEGEALDIDQLLYGSDGKPRVPIFYIAHLSDPERMFFVSLLLNQILGWMRGQAGTTSLRAVLYIDEIFGFIPPVGNPAAKKPLLTLLKQARAFGLGLVLATQNPVDLDYKGLSNTGTWFIGRLQTERDRDRVLDGLLSASGSEGSFDRKTLERIVSNLDKRIFLLHNVHERTPEIFHTRWAMSYLCGPLTRTQIKKLTPEGENIRTDVETFERKTAKSKKAAQPPVLGPGLSPLYVPVKSPRPAGAELLYRPYLLGSAEVYFFDKPTATKFTKKLSLITAIEESAVPVDWETAVTVNIARGELSKQPEESSRFDDVPAAAKKEHNYKTWHTEFENCLYRSQKLVLLKSPTFGETSLPGEDEREFRIRLSQMARERRDEWTKRLREKYAKRIEGVEAKIRRAQERLEREQDQAKQQKLQTAISIGTTLLGAFLGRKAVSRSTIGKAGTAMRHAGRTMKERGDVERAAANIDVLQQELEELEEKFRQEVDEFSDRFDALREELETTFIRPLKKDISVVLLSFVWVPHWIIKNEIHSMA